MSSPFPPPRFTTSAWILLALLAGWLLWNHQARIGRIARVTALPEWSVDVPAPDAASLTGYTGGWRRLILPEHDYRSYQWIAISQQMLADGSGRVRHLPGENAPHGRPTNMAAPYAWWLAGLAWVDHAVTGIPAGRAVERAALYADPLWQVIFLLAAGWLAMRSFGGLAAGMVLAGFALWFPLAGNFLPGSPGQSGLFLGVNLLGLVGLVAGLKQEGDAIIAPGSRRGIFAFAGACGGLGLWLDAPAQLALVLGLLLGGAAVKLAFRTRVEKSGLNVSTVDWRGWGNAGAAVSLLGYLVEYAPNELRFRLETNHPLYALAWYGAGELLARLTAGAAAPGWRKAVSWTGPVLALLALPVTLAFGDGLLPWELNPDAGRLSVLSHLAAERLPLVAALLPLGLAVVMAGLACRRPNPGAMLLLAGPVLVLLGLAAWQPAWWSFLQVAGLGLILCALPAKAGAAWPAAAVLVAIPGLALLFQPRATAETNSLTESELVGLIERDFAHHLARQGQGRNLVALAPPEMTGALHYYAGLHGLGTFAWENRAGLTAAARIASASSPDEAFQLVERRGVTHIVMPGWDRFLDDYAGLGRGAKTGAAADNSFVAAMHRWEQPEWLRPRAYQIPHIPGFEGQSVTVFEVVDPQDGVGAMSRMAEYFVETGQLEMAGRAKQSLRRYPAHVGALVAMAKVDAARQDSAAFAETVSHLMPLLEAGAARTLPWDRRVSLAVVLATARKAQPAREQLQQCLREATDARLRALPTQALFQLLTLANRQGLGFSTPELERVALELLPPEARGRI